MSATKAVAALIEELGSGTVDDILADMPGHTRQQVISALQRAAWAGLITCDGPAARVRRGSKPGTYRAKPPAVTPTRAVRSVFELAQHA